MIKYYKFAGIDLMISERGHVYFIEANSAPYGLKAYIDLYGKCKPLDELVKYLQRYDEVAIMHNYKGVELEQSAFVVNYLKHKMRNLKVCMLEDNRENFIKGDGSLVTEDGEKIYPDVLLRQHWSSKKSRPAALRKAGVEIINPICIVETTKDKAVTHQAIEEFAPQVNLPKQFQVKTKQEIGKILKNNPTFFRNGFVLKPRCGTRSEGVFIFNSYQEIECDFEMTKPYLLEERIMPVNLFPENYFDIRAHAVNGKYISSIVRVSKSPVTGISAGAIPKRIPKEFEPKIKRSVELIIQAIDRFSERFL